MVGGGEFGAAQGGGNQGVMRKEIDPAREPGRRLKERFFRRGIEEWDSGAGEV